MTKYITTEMRGSVLDTVVLATGWGLAERQRRRPWFLLGTVGGGWLAIIAEQFTIWNVNILPNNILLYIANSYKSYLPG